jgi:DNA polymerase-3 subunit gamma/tau
VLDQLVAGSDEAGLTYERAIALLGYTDATLLDEIADAFAAADGAAVFRVVNRIIEGGHEPRRFAADLLDRFRDLIVLASVPDAAQIGLLDAPPDRLELMSQQAARFGLASLTRAAQIMSDGLDQMRGATSPRLVLELMCAQVLLPSADTGEKALLARLERLERLERGVGVAGAQAAPQAAPSGVPSAARPAATPAAPQAAPSGVPPAARPAATPAAPPSAPAAGPVVSRPAAVSGPAAPPPPAAPDDTAAPAPTEPGDAAAPDEPDVEPAPPVPAGRPADQGAPPAQPASSGEPAGAGLTTTESFSQNWDAVLEAIKRERRVAWMLLSNATVLSLDGTVLTLRFARDGDVKGFTTSGCDADLKRVLSSRFGLNVTVKAVSANDPAAAREGRPRLNPVPAPPAAPESPAAAAGDWPGARATGDRQDPGGWGGPATQPNSGDGGGGRAPGSGGAAPQASAPPRASATTPASAPPARPAGRTAPAGSAQTASPAGPPPAPAAAAPAAPAAPAPAAPRRSAAPGPAASGAFEIPDEDDLASPGQAEISGMDLIQRELGGQIIGEIDD